MSIKKVRLRVLDPVWQFSTQHGSKFMTFQTDLQAIKIDTPNPRWAIWQFVWLFIILFVLKGVLGIIFIHITGRQYLATIGHIIAILATIYLLIHVIRKKGYDYLSILRIRRIPKNTRLALFILGIAVVLLAMLAETWLPKLLSVLFSYHPRTLEAPEPIPLWARSFGLVAAIFLAPLWEEMSLRGLVQTSFEQAYGARLAVIIVGLIFGILHFRPISHIITMSCYGMVLSWIVYKTNTIIPVIVFHMSANGFARISPLFSSQMVNGQLMLNYPAISILTACIGLVLLPLGCFLLIFNLNKYSASNTDTLFPSRIK